MILFQLLHYSYKHVQINAMNIHKEYVLPCTTYCEGITIAAGWVLGCMVHADASLSCCDIWTQCFDFF